MSECPLTERETEIVAAMADGLTVKEVARRLGLSISVVEDAMRILRAKTGRTRIQGIVGKSLREGWVQ
jgi:DNA-binding CsgD family transcriptional regulator